MSLFDRMRQGATEAARKVEQTVEVTRLQARISAREKEMERLYARIGRAVYRSYGDGAVDAAEKETLVCCEELRQLEDEIERIREQIRYIRLEKNCSGCGKTVPLDVHYCPACGTEFAEETRPAGPPPAELRIICGTCKAENEPSARYCRDCGREMTPQLPE